MKLLNRFSLGIFASLVAINAYAQQTTSYTYNAAGQVLTEDGPRTDVVDVTTHTYNSQGYVATTTNALNQVATFNSYDASGNLLSMTDANGVFSEFTYHDRGWLLSSRVKHPTDSALDAVTSYGYDAVGQLTSTTLPNGVVLNYEYDDARRLKAIKNSLNERIEYTLDAAGNRTRQVIKNASGTIKYSVSSVYDELSRVMKVLGNNSQQDKHQYDVNNNRTSTTDGRNNQTQQIYDALNRVKKIIDPALGETQFTYNAQDQIKTVTDARGNTTTYHYDGLGNLTSQVSPDTGTTSFTYDAAGNRLSQTDARGVVANYAYDALNRITSITYPAAPTENVTFVYDGTSSGNKGIGRLVEISKAGVSVSYRYDHSGRVTQQTNTVSSVNAQINYDYDLAGNISQITYPSGRNVNYVYDAQGRINQITTRLGSAATQTLVNNIGYLPFGPATNYVYGNGLSHTQTFDTDYRLTAIQVGGILSRNYGYDPVNNITSIVNALNTSANQTFSYDSLNRLISASGGYGNLGYSYDAVGNRLNETRNGTTDTYTYPGTNNRLQQITRAAGNRTFTYDAAGNPQQRTAENNSNQSFTFNKANRLETASVNGSLAATYSYNPLGQRVLKTLANATKEIYHYDQSGQLIAVTDGAGTTLREYIYWSNQQIAFTNTVQGQSIAAQTLDEANVSFQGAHVIATTNAGYTGSGFIDYVGEGSASWSVNAPATASYNLTLRYGLSGADRPLVLKVDGNTIATINFVSSPLWTTWKTKTVTLNLTAGQHTIALHTSGLSGPNVDKVDLAAVNPVTTTSTSLYYVHSDHLNTPQVITNQNQQVVWMGNYEPFGKLAANTNNSIEIFSRFPGQYVDPETGLYYNYFRDYDPSIGRYIESDPIGLRGGINTYAYVQGNPLKYSDPLGLAPNKGCVLTYTAAGATVGGAIGYGGGFLGGGFAGAFAGGVGAIPGAAGGSQLGGIAGAAAGSGTGYMIAQWVCPDDDDASPNEDDSETECPPNNEDPDKCKKARTNCAAECSGILPDSDLQSMNFQKCYSDCLSRAGCLGVK